MIHFSSSVAFLTFDFRPCPRVGTQTVCVRRYPYNTIQARDIQGYKGDYYILNERDAAHHISRREPSTSAPSSREILGVERRGGTTEGGRGRGRAHRSHVAGHQERSTRTGLQEPAARNLGRKCKAWSHYGGPRKGILCLCQIPTTMLHYLAASTQL